MTSIAEPEPIQCGGSDSGFTYRKSNKIGQLLNLNQQFLLSFSIKHVLMTKNVYIWTSLMKQISIIIFLIIKIFKKHFLVCSRRRSRSQKGGRIRNTAYNLILFKYRLLRDLEHSRGIHPDVQFVA